MYSLIIKNVQLIDGTGTPARKSDVAIEKDSIVAIAETIDSSAHNVFDGKGKVLAPGFIDIQNHSDSYWQLFDNPTLDSMVVQGYTTILIGNCGASLAPLLSQEALLALQKWHNLEGTNINWQTFGEFATALGERRFGTNVGSLVGYSTLRRGLMGDRTDPVTNDELKALRSALETAVNEGAFGLSTGLAYAHEAATSEVELFELAETLKQTGGLLSVHLRNESEQVVESVREAITLAQRAEVELKISHLKVRNPANWGLLDQVIMELDNAWHRGIKIHFDMYPYTSIWQVLYSYLPKWAISGGRHAILEHLHNPVQRNKILRYLNDQSANIKNLVIASTSGGLHISGKTIGKLAADLEVSSEEALLNIIEHGGSEILVFDECLQAEGVSELMHHPLGFIASDAAGFDVDGLREKLVHPRSFGTVPRYLNLVLANKKIGLPEAIRKLTSGPASMLGLEKRGVIQTGNYADLVLINPDTINSKATLTNPYQIPIGIENVWVNGQQVVRNSRGLKVTAGRFLRKTK